MAAHTYDEYEDLIVDQLKTGILDTDCEIVPAQETDAAFSMAATKGRIVVQYVASRFGKTKQIGTISQEETQLYEITVQSKRLRTGKGCYKLIELAKTLLLGYQPLNSSKMYVDTGDDEKIALIERNPVNGVFTFRMLLCVETTFVQAVPVPEFDGPPLVKVDVVVTGINEDKNNEGLGYMDRIGESKIGEELP